MCGCPTHSNCCARAVVSRTANAESDGLSGQTGVRRARSSALYDPTRVLPASDMHKISRPRKGGFTRCAAGTAGWLYDPTRVLPASDMTDMHKISRPRRGQFTRSAAF